MTQPRLIGFTGLKGSGKDTAGAVFVHHEWTKISFAEPLKAMLRTLLEIRHPGLAPLDVDRFLEGDKKEVPSGLLMGRSPRHAMQTLGTEWGRNLIDDALWIDTFERRAARLLAARHGVVVTDVRFPNEVEAIKRLGGRVFRVMRDGGVAQDHPSEALVMSLPVDGVIVNNAPTAIDFQKHIEARFF